jgi:hypothetical protein
MTASNNQGDPQVESADRSQAVAIGASVTNLRGVVLN